MFFFSFRNADCIEVLCCAFREMKKLKESAKEGYILCKESNSSIRCKFIQAR
jgi:hypothetical protein